MNIFKRVVMTMCLLVLCSFLFNPAAHSAVEDAGVTLAWSKQAEDDHKGFYVYFSKGTIVPSRLLSNGYIDSTKGGKHIDKIRVGNVTSYTVRGLTLGKQYYFTVSAYNAQGNESAVVHDKAGPDGVPMEIAAKAKVIIFPSAPIGLKEVTVNVNNITPIK